MLGSFGLSFIAQVLRTDLQPSVERGQVQGRLLPAVSHGGVGQLVEQHGDHIRVAVLGCAVERRLLLVVLWKNKRGEGVSDGGGATGNLSQQVLLFLAPSSVSENMEKVCLNVTRSW